MIQDVVSLLSSSDLNELPQEKRCSLGDGGQLCDVFGLPLQAVDLNGGNVQINTYEQRLQTAEAG